MQSLDKFQFYEMNDYSVPMRNLPKKKGDCDKLI
jgi:hypothetical protein